MNSQFFMSKTVKNWEFSFFVLKTIKNVGNSHVSFTLATKKFLILGGIPNEKCG